MDSRKRGSDRFFCLKRLCPQGRRWEWDFFAENMMSTLDSSNFSVAQMISSSKTQGVVSAHTIELAAMVLASLPMIILYPFAQRFFVKGVLLGSVKG